MRTIADIKKSMTDVFISNNTIKQVYGLKDGFTFEDQFSVVSLESVLFECVAFAIWTLETLFDLHKSEVTDYIANMKPHTVRWYATKAKMFQYGFNLLADSDLYDNTDKTDEEIQASKIVAYSAVVESDKQLVIKVAKDTGDLAPLTVVELAAFKEYIARIKDAGVVTNIISEVADNLSLEIDLYYNPLVLNANGQRLDGSSMTPVADAVRNYLKVLPFNGEFVLAYLTDALQGVDGVVIPHIRTAKYKYGGLSWLDIVVKYTPYSGYLRIADTVDLKINYIPQTEIR